MGTRKDPLATLILQQIEIQMTSTSSLANLASHLLKMSLISRTKRKEMVANIAGIKREGIASATEKAAGHTRPKEKRKEMKHNKGDDGDRVVTDPVTHLPLVIRDSQRKISEDHVRMKLCRASTRRLLLT